MPQPQIGIIESHGCECVRESPSICEKELNCPLRRSTNFPSGPGLSPGQLMREVINGNREKGSGEPSHPSSSLPSRQSGFLFYPRAVREPAVASTPTHPYCIESSPVPLRLICSANLISTLIVGSAARVLVATAHIFPRYGKTPKIPTLPLHANFTGRHRIPLLGRCRLAVSKEREDPEHGPHQVFGEGRRRLNF